MAKTTGQQAGAATRPEWVPEACAAEAWAPVVPFEPERARVERELEDVAELRRKIIDGEVAVTAGGFALAEHEDQLLRAGIAVCEQILPHIRGIRGSVSAANQRAHEAARGALDRAMAEVTDKLVSIGYHKTDDLMDRSRIIPMYLYAHPDVIAARAVSLSSAPPAPCDCGAFVEEARDRYVARRVALRRAAAGM